MKYLVLLLLMGCGTTTLTTCTEKVYDHKEECIEKTKARQERLRPVQERMMDYGGRI